MARTRTRASSDDQVPTPRAPALRTVVILLFDDVEVLDFAGPFEVFSVASELVGPDRLRVVTAATTHRAVRAIGGLAVLPAHTLQDCPAPDVLVVPGGDGSRRAMDDADVLAWISKVHGAAEIVMSVCSGARILARAGLLDGRSVTTHHQVTEHLRELAPRAHVQPGRRFIDSGRIITTGGISAGIDGSFHVVKRLFGEAVGREVAAYMEYEGHGAYEVDGAYGVDGAYEGCGAAFPHPSKQSPGEGDRS